MKWSTPAVVIVWALALVRTAFAQPKPEWVRNINAPGYDEFLSLCPRPDGGWIAAGFDDTTHNIYGSNCSWLLSMGLDQSVRWDKKGETGEISYITQTRRGVPKPGGIGYIASGVVNSGTRWNGRAVTDVDAAIHWIDTAGNIQRTRAYGGSENDFIRCVTPTPDGHFVFCGETLSEDGDIIGYHPSSLSYRTRDAWIGEVDSAGNLLWSKVMGGSAEDGASRVVVLADGSLVVLITTNSSDGDFYDGSLERMVLVHLEKGQSRFTSRPLTEWVRSSGVGLEVDGQGNLLVAGSLLVLDSASGLHLSVWLAKISPQLETLWCDSAILKSGFPNALSVATNGDILLGGVPEAGSDSEIFVARFDSSGRLLWTSNYRVPASAEGLQYLDPTVRAIAPAQDGGFALTGDGIYTIADKQMTGAYIARFPPDVLAVNHSEATPIIHEKSYPNPSLSFVSVPYSVPIGTTVSRVAVHVSSISGKSMCDFETTVSNEPVRIDTHAWPSGMYDCAITVGDQVIASSSFVVER